MKLKLDLHPIYNDAQKIEKALQDVIDAAVAQHASAVEIIPGKGSGALKKTVLRFLDRPEVKARYHRLEKDSDNWGRLFVHFRHTNRQHTPPESLKAAKFTVPCVCCSAGIAFLLPDAEVLEVLLECPACGSPHLVSLRWDRSGRAWPKADLHYG
jgi:hypothetical protein